MVLATLALHPVQLSIVINREAIDEGFVQQGFVRTEYVECTCGCDPATFFAVGRGLDAKAGQAIITPGFYWPDEEEAAARGSATLWILTEEKDIEEFTALPRVGSMALLLGVGPALKRAFAV